MTRKSALLVASSGSADGALPLLSTPQNDVLQMAEVLEDPRIGGFDEVEPVIDGPEREVRRKIARFFANRRTEDLVLFYFSGHGLLDDRGLLHFVMSDTEKEILSATSISASFLKDEVSKCWSRRRVLILDCCYSGAFNRDHIGSKSTNVTKVNLGVQFDVGGYGWFLITASDALEMAFEGHVLDEQINNSIFSYFILKGLTSGDADINRDGLISIDELYDYVYAQMSDLKLKGKQTPCSFADAQKGRIIIARNPHLEASDAGAVSVWDQIYQKHFAPVGLKTSLETIIEISLNAYNDIYWINCYRGNWPREQVGLFDHDLAFLMAGWMKAHLNNGALAPMTQAKLAAKITDYILRPNDTPSDPVYAMMVERTYRRYFAHVNQDSSLLYIYQQAGKVYLDIYQMNLNTERWKKMDELDHKLIFYIGCWIKDNIVHPGVSDMSRKELAGKIADQIVASQISSTYLDNFLQDYLYTPLDPSDEYDAD